VKPSRPILAVKKKRNPPKSAPPVSTVTATEQGDSLSSRVFTGHAAEAIRDLDRRIDALLPLAVVGENVKKGPGKRKKDKDHRDFVRIALEILERQPELQQPELLKDPSLGYYVDQYPDQVKVWCREVYPDRPVGRPRKK
jgi:hypothetical protein